MLDGLKYFMSTKSHNPQYLIFIKVEETAGCSRPYAVTFLKAQLKAMLSIKSAKEKKERNSGKVRCFLGG